MSPTVYLLPEEKVYFKRLKAHILLISGESISDHQLIMPSGNMRRNIIQIINDTK